jgi:hypothetical protein
MGQFWLSAFSKWPTETRPHTPGPDATPAASIMQASYIMAGLSACHHPATTSASLVTQHSQQGRPCSRWPPQTGQQTPGAQAALMHACRLATSWQGSVHATTQTPVQAFITQHSQQMKAIQAVDGHLRLGSIHLALKQPRCMHACRLATSIMAGLSACHHPATTSAGLVTQHSQQ